MFCGAASEDVVVFAPVKVQLVVEPGVNTCPSEKLKLCPLKHWSGCGLMTTGGLGSTVSANVTVLSHPLMVWKVNG